MNLIEVENDLRRVSKAADDARASLEKLDQTKVRLNVEFCEPGKPVTPDASLGRRGMIRFATGEWRVIHRLMSIAIRDLDYGRDSTATELFKKGRSILERIVNSGVLNA